jgi:hypothetical protein
MSGRDGSGRPRLARLWAALAVLLALAFMGGAVGAAAAEVRSTAPAAASLLELATTPSADTPDDEIVVSLERAEDFEPSDNPNAVLVDAILRDKAGNVPTGTYRVFVSVAPYLPEPGVDATPSKPEPCRQPHFSTNPEIDEGVFRCSYLVDFPETWTFSVVVNRLVDGKLVKLAQAAATFPVSDAVILQGLAGLQYAIKGNPFEILLVQVHIAAASVWLVVVMAMTFLAVPRMRRMLSKSTLYRLDVRLYFLNGFMWVMFGAVLVSGLFLLGARSAYGMPWSKAEWDQVIELPYASIYFTTLYAKILAFLVVGAASMVLMLEANRQARIADGSAGFDTSDDEFWRRLHFQDAMRDTGERVAKRRPDEAGNVATAVASTKLKARLLATGVSPRTLGWCVFAAAGGLGAIGVCVTVLKYTHELIEMLLAAEAIAEAE